MQTHCMLGPSLRFWAIVLRTWGYRYEIPSTLEGYQGHLLDALRILYSFWNLSAKLRMDIGSVYQSKCEALHEVRNRILVSRNT